MEVKNMVRKKQRQALGTSVYELRKVADMMELEGMTLARKLHIKYEPRERCLIAIANDSGESDDWRFD
jgi:hypothetical protein